MPRATVPKKPATEHFFPVLSISRFNRKNSERMSAALLIAQFPIFLQRAIDDVFDLGPEYHELKRIGGGGTRIEYCFENDSRTTFAMKGQMRPSPSRIQHCPKRRGDPVRASNSLARTCSGDIYATVPTAIINPGLVRCSASTNPVCVLKDRNLATKNYPRKTDFRQSKVENLGMSALGHEDVRRLDVAVDNAFREPHLVRPAISIARRQKSTRFPSAGQQSGA